MGMSSGTGMNNAGTDGGTAAGDGIETDASQRFRTRGWIRSNIIELHWSLVEVRCDRTGVGVSGTELELLCMIVGVSSAS